MHIYSLNNAVCNCCESRNVAYQETLHIKKPGEGCQGTISLTTFLENLKKDVKRETKDDLKKDIINKNMKRKIKDS